ncbi:Crp/Fnr family transcriptional regulator [Sphingobium amiense]|uniref:Crp/Fnr family transcriptional regulator n=1 Tax=Sphingobium amiense TaxID=135719 RepID=A0A494VXN2_9SPHN|nr:Crp/Fnr family transcriptional regulator [Sphingobium amiense]BBD97144.1 Crp/Fnr family transcriptional regulator [Sphingobium amiense]
MQPPYHRLEEFVTLSADEAEIVKGWAANRREVKRYRAIRREGEPVAAVYFLMEGWVGSSLMLRDGRRQIVKVHLPGDLLGFPSLALASAGETLEALTDAVVCPLPPGVVGKILAENPRLAAGLFLSTQKERVALMQQLAWVGATSALERLIAFLLDLHDRLVAANLVKDGSFEFPLTQQHLGELLGLTTVHVNRTLRRLDETGLVERSRARMRIKDVQELREAAATVAPLFAGQEAWNRLGNPS